MATESGSISADDGRTCAEDYLSPDSGSVRRDMCTRRGRNSPHYPGNTKLSGAVTQDGADRAVPANQNPPDDWAVRLVEPSAVACADEVCPGSTMTRFAMRLRKHDSCAGLIVGR
jgi:hypothetical protein